MSSQGSFYPAYSNIIDISQDNPAVATFSAPHDFTVGEIVSFRVSPAFGMFEMNNQELLVLDITTDTITVDINSENFTAFYLPPYQIPITDILVNTPTVGMTQIQFASNPFIDGQYAFFQNVEGTMDVINLQKLIVSGATSTTFEVDFDSSGLTYGGGGNATIYPFTLFTYLPVVVPSSSGVVPGAFPAQTNLLDTFDHRPPN